jgi:hypothetical protein
VAPCPCSQCLAASTPERDNDVEQIAAAVAERLQDSLLKLPAEVVDLLKPFTGYTTRWVMTGGFDATYAETQVLADGGLRFAVMAPTGYTLFERTFRP